MPNRPNNTRCKLDSFGRFGINGCMRSRVATRFTPPHWGYIPRPGVAGVSLGTPPAAALHCDWLIMARMHHALMRTCCTRPHSLTQNLSRARASLTAPVKASHHAQMRTCYARPHLLTQNLSRARASLTAPLKADTPAQTFFYTPAGRTNTAASAQVRASQRASGSVILRQCKVSAKKKRCEYTRFFLRPRLEVNTRSHHSNPLEMRRACGLTNARRAGTAPAQCLAIASHARLPPSVDRLYSKTLRFASKPLPFVVAVQAQ